MHIVNKQQAQDNNSNIPQPGEPGAESRFINRESSLLEFNRRVLSLAERQDVPLLERLKFLCISSSNMDEFFEVRLAGILELTRNPNARTVPDGMHPSDAAKMLHETAHQLVAEQYEVLNDQLIPALADAGIHFLHRARWTPEQKDWLRNYFQDNLQPVLTPLGLDPSHPFPRVLNKALHFIVSLSGRDAFGGTTNMAVVRVPRSLPRIIELPAELGDGKNFVFLSSILHAHVDELFSGMKVNACHQFRLTRNTNLFVDEEEVDDVATALEGELSSRDYGDPIRLEVSDTCPDELSRYLLDQFKLGVRSLYQVNGPVNLTRLSAVPDRAGRPDLEFPPYTPACLPSFTPITAKHTSDSDSDTKTDMFARIRRGDILLHHPYQSFAPVIDFLRQAASDPNVLAIRMTLYRTGENSAIIDALERAARNGKEVSVIAEVRARFDEDNNIRQAARLHEASAHVVYGVVGLKTHAKMVLVVRREPDGSLKRYMHLGTGNYHHITTRFYTDFGLLTCDEAIGRDVSRIFQQLTSLSSTEGLEDLLQSPFSLHSGMIERIEREARLAQEGKPARIIAKMNGLQEQKIIEALYAASQAGVQIDLIVRGICCLRAGVPGLSENIRVRSILGRFLEHHRVFYFGNDGNPELFLASADWMKRNLLGRVETCFPVKDPVLFERVYKEGLEIYLRDEKCAYILQTDGSYLPVTATHEADALPFSAQGSLMQQYSS